MYTRVSWIEAPEAPGRLGVMPRPRGGDWLDDELRQLRRGGVDVLVSLLTPDEAAELALSEESALAARCGLEFLSLPIRDRDVPGAAAPVGALSARLALALRQGRAVVIHCRMGIGRAAIIAAVLMRELGVVGGDALARIERARGRPVPDTDAQRAWVIGIGSCPHPKPSPPTGRGSRARRRAG